MLSPAVKNSLQHQKNAIFKGTNLVMLLINIAIDLLFNIIDFAFGLIDGLTLMTRTIVSVLYHVLKVLTGVALRGILTPFIGPFAWIVGMIVDFGIDWVERTLNLREIVANIVDYILREGAAHITSFITTFVSG